MRPDRDLAETPSRHLQDTLRFPPICQSWMDDGRQASSRDSISKDNAICQTVIEELPPQTKKGRPFEILSAASS